ncbi:ras GTPase-activating protein-binding protein 1-like [Patiria miniata]|uniref:Ras GTPase-activating protein-binding protein 1 n=1 Tax=Patiria miniata TaxID=46514 RepID=A0A914A9A0_PATMI|nr:ras GTPase-activating protein-binding protein 1-like [Patiria miniata]
MVMATNPQSAPSAAPAGAQRTAAPNTSDANIAGNNAVVSPESVGREFVRQYYTLLNRGPEHLHRFYLNNSSFVHGGVDPDGNPEEPVYGQMDINEKILSLNFRDCHAKIRQVDSHATLGEGVVVQVTGELSNNGEPMRRFMQTFVLAPQSAKKYYVRNDIFRYQDEVFNDTDSEPENDGCGSVSEGEEATAEQPISTDISVQDATVSSYYEPHQPVVSNGTAHLESPETTPTKPAEISDPVGMEITQESPPTISEEVAQPPAPAMDNHEQEPEEEQPEPEEPVDKGPKVPSWADKARNVPTAASTPPSSNYPSMQTQPVPNQKPSEPSAQASNPGGPPRGGGMEPLPQREPRRDRDREGQRDLRGRPTGGRRPMEGPEQGNRPRAPQNPDSHQLFVGNLPQDVNDEELREFFSTFGTVLDMRINRNTGPKPLPYFGFIVFSDRLPVQTILKQKTKGPILLRGEHRLNVEEKKTKRPGSGGPPRGGASGRGGPRGGMGGGINKGGGPGRGYNPQR